jgi:hypothetical protein
MKKLLPILLATLLLSGCVPQAGSACIEEDYNQVLRRQLFKECLDSVPEGPSTTTFNDWSEVVNNCDMISARQSIEYINVCAQKAVLLNPEPITNN